MKAKKTYEKRSSKENIINGEKEISSGGGKTMKRRRAKKAAKKVGSSEATTWRGLDVYRTCLSAYYSARSLATTFSFCSALRCHTIVLLLLAHYAPSGATYNILLSISMPEAALCCLLTLLTSQHRLPLLTPHSCHTSCLPCLPWPLCLPSALPPALHTHTRITEVPSPFHASQA